MGRPRVIPQEKPHRSVKVRMEARCHKEGDRYKPMPDVSGAKLEWVD